MASTIYFDNKQISLPGAYSTIVSGETNPPRAADYGIVLIIDTGVAGANYGGGSGINGTLASGQDAIYTFQTLEEFRNFEKGGLFWKIAERLFTPDPSNAAATGISSLYFIRAATTAPSKMTFSTEAGGSFVVDTRDEGTWANGVTELATPNKLISGYGYTISKGVEDETKWIMSFYRGTYTGTAEDGLPFGEESSISSVPKLLCESPEFNNIKTLIDWGKNDGTFNVYFSLDSASNVEGSGVVSAEDIAAIAGLVKATGGTETYGPTDFDSVLSQIADLDHNIVFTDQYGNNASGSMTQKLIAHNNFTAKFNRFLYVGGYGDNLKYKDDLALAKGFDSEKVILIHGETGQNSQQAGIGYRWWTVMYTLASVVGRVSGKPPYVPVTNKSLGVDRIKHILSDTEKKQALKNGVIVVSKNAYSNKFVILQDVNTLQDNTNLFNSKGQSYSIQFMRIVAQINRELVVNAEIDLLGQENGPNANTLSAGTVKNWTANYLQSRVATETSDNLLLEYKDVNVTRQEDVWFITYKIKVNNEITKLFFTGFLIR